MKLQGSIIKEQGVTFAVVIVKKQILDNTSEANNVIRAFTPIFGGIPVVLMAQDYSGRPSYFGRQDIVKFLANVPMEAIPWKEYTVNL
jgi:hypothetical protein